MKVRIVDNGTRCFVPPCYSWDVYALDGGDRLTSVARILTPDGRAIVDPGSDPTVHATDGIVEGEFDDYVVDDGPNAGMTARQLVLHQPD